MELIINPQFGLKFDESFEFVANYHKGKKISHDIGNIRSHFRGVRNGTDMFLYVPDGFMSISPVMNIGERIEFIYFNELTEIEAGHYRNRQYHYYFWNNNPLMVNQWLRKWENSNPLVHIGGYLHQHIKSIPNYTWAYQFNGQQY